MYVKIFFLPLLFPSLYIINMFMFYCMMLRHINCSTKGISRAKTTHNTPSKIKTEKSFLFSFFDDKRIKKFLEKVLKQET